MKRPRPPEHKPKPKREPAPKREPKQKPKPQRAPQPGLQPKPEAGPKPFRPVAHLFSVPAKEVAAKLASYPDLLRRALALTPSREREIPHLVRALSLSLTAEREGGPKPGYLSEPRTLAAYAWYFLPWNLIRLTRLLPGLDLPLPDGGTVCDLGAGPLTLAQALWLARPDLREKRLQIVAVDRSRRALDLGVTLFAGLAGYDPTTDAGPWRVRLVRGEYWQGLPDGCDLISLVNVANEMAGLGREPLAERMERLALRLAESLAPGGRLLAVEPGTRLGWRCLEGMRSALIEEGLAVPAPCPHNRPCPLAASKARAWCHFTLPPAGAPGWLTALSERAGLAKERLSLGYLLAAGEAVRPGPDLARVVSNPFSLPDTVGKAVYACSAKGLLLLVSTGERWLRSGDLVAVTVPQGAPLDAKSGAIRIEAGRAGPASAPPKEAEAKPVSRPRPKPAGPSPGRSEKGPARAGRGAGHAGKGPGRAGRGPARAGKPAAKRSNVRGGRKKSG